MNSLNISGNLVRLRHEKKVTQGQIADFIGVTKASVSKWETGQSTPDIMLLPQLAAYFDVSVDELLGYEPQLTKEQIDRIYRELSQGFAEQPLTEMLERTKKLVKQYYSCYPFLFQMCVLWLNHCPMIPEVEKRNALLQDILEICGHITEGCVDFSVREEAVVMRAQVNLLLGRCEETIEELEGYQNVAQLTAQHRKYMLLQGYIMKGEQNQAAGYAQLCMYESLLSIVGVGGIYLGICQENISHAEEILRRTERLIEDYKLERLNPNAAFQFYYQAALMYCQKSEKQKAVFYLKKCRDCIKNLLEEKEFRIHGDRYFYLLEEQLARLGVNENAPRDRKLVLQDIRSLCDNPTFAVLQEEPEFLRLKKQLQEVQ